MGGLRLREGVASTLLILRHAVSAQFTSRVITVMSGMASRHRTPPPGTPLSGETATFLPLFLPAPHPGCHETLKVLPFGPSPVTASVNGLLSSVSSPDIQSPRSGPNTCSLPVCYSVACPPTHPKPGLALTRPSLQNDLQVPQMPPPLLL